MLLQACALHSNIMALSAEKMDSDLDRQAKELVTRARISICEAKMMAVFQEDTSARAKRPAIVSATKELRLVVGKGEEKNILPGPLHAQCQMILNLEGP